MATKRSTSKPTKTKPKTKAKPKPRSAAAPKPKAKPSAKPASNTKAAGSHTDALKTLTKAFVGKRAFCEIPWFRDSRKLAAKIFDWSAIDEAEKDDLVNDTFSDGIIEALMEHGEEGYCFRPFAIPFAYLGAFPTPDELAQHEGIGDWVVQADGLLIYDTRDGSIHRVIIDGTAMVDDVRQAAPSIEKLGVQALA